MSDDVYSTTTNITDPTCIHAEMEKHRAEAIAKFGTEHAIFGGSSTTSVPTYDNEGRPTGHIYVVQSTWRRPPPQPELAPAVAEGKVGSLGTE